MNQPPSQHGPSWPPPAYAAQPPGIPYDRDADHLRMLSIFYYIWGGLVLLGSCFFIFYIFMGATFSAGTFPTTPGQAPLPPQFGRMFEIVGIVGLGAGWILGGLSIYAGYCLARRKNAILIMVVAALCCLSIPLGTVLGVFTFIVTSRPTVKAMFAAGNRW